MSIPVTPPHAALPPGVLLRDRYRIERLIGSGGMGHVYLARDLSLEVPVAIKTVVAALCNDPVALERLKDEARLAMRLSHPHIVRVNHYDDSGDLKFLVMEYVDGESLLHRLAARGPLSEQQARQFGILLCQALAHAHDLQVLHRDIKPANVLLGRDGTVKLADFGIASIAKDSMARATGGRTSGTLMYMPPERLLGKSGTPRSDLYSLGALLYELIAGHPPFYQGDITWQALHEAPIPLSDVSAQFNASVLALLAKSPAERVGSARELQRQLEGTFPGGVDPGGESEGATIVLESQEPAADAVAESSPPADEPRRAASGSSPTSGAVLLQPEPQLLAAPCPICGRDLNTQQRFRCRRCDRDVCEFHREDRGCCTSCTRRARRARLVSVIGAVAALLAGVALTMWMRQSHGDGTAKQEKTTPAAANAASDAGAPPLSRPTANPAGSGAASARGDSKGGASDRAAIEPAGAVARLVLPSGTGAAHSVSVSPGGRLIAVGYKPGVVKVWNAGTGETTATFSGLVGAVSALTFSPDGRHLAARAADQTIRVWDVTSQAEVARLAGHRDQVWSLAYAPSGRLLASGSADTTVRLWDMITGTLSDTLAGHTDWVTAVAFSEDGRTVISGGRDRTVRTWDVNGARQVNAIETESPVLALAASRQLIAAGEESGDVTLHDLSTGAVVGVIETRGGAVWALAFDRSGRRIASGGSDGVLRIWEIPDRRLSVSFAAHGTWIKGLAFGPNDAWIVAAAGDGTVPCWRLSR